MIITRAIKSSRPFKSSIFREEMQAMAHIVARSVKLDYERTTATWKDKPKFKEEIKVGQGKIEIEVSTDDDVYGYVDYGTKAHIIRPRHKKALAFRGGKYRAKTKPNVIGSTAGGSSGKIVLAQEVHHPGTKARNFSKIIRNKWKGDFQRQVKNALARFVTRSGHKV